VVSFIEVFTIKILNQIFSTSPRVLHVPPVSSSLI